MLAPLLSLITLALSGTEATGLTSLFPESDEEIERKRKKILFEQEQADRKQELEDKADTRAGSFAERVARADPLLRISLADKLDKKVGGRLSPGAGFLSKADMPIEVFSDDDRPENISTLRLAGGRGIPGQARDALRWGVTPTRDLESIIKSAEPMVNRNVVLSHLAQGQGIDVIGIKKQLLASRVSAEKDRLARNDRLGNEGNDLIDKYEAASLAYSRILSKATAKGALLTDEERQKADEAADVSQLRDAVTARAEQIKQFYVQNRMVVPSFIKRYVTKRFVTRDGRNLGPLMTFSERIDGFFGKSDSDPLNVKALYKGVGGFEGAKNTTLEEFNKVLDSLVDARAKDPERTVHFMPMVKWLTSMRDRFANPDKVKSLDDLVRVYDALSGLMKLYEGENGTQSAIGLSTILRQVTDNIKAALGVQTASTSTVEEKGVPLLGGSRTTGYLIGGPVPGKGGAKIPKAHQPTSYTPQRPEIHDTGRARAFKRLKEENKRLQDMRRKLGVKSYTKPPGRRKTSSRSASLFVGTASAGPKARAAVKPFIKGVENPKGVGFRNGRYYPHKSAEKGSKKTVAHGHLIQPDEDFSKGLTPKEADDLLDKDIKIAEDKAIKVIARSVLEAKKKGLTLTSYEKLDINSKQMVIDFFYNLGSMRTHPLFLRAILSNDVATMKKEYKRFFKNKDGVYKPLKDRNKKFRASFLAHLKKKKKKKGGITTKKISGPSISRPRISRPTNSLGMAQ